MKSILQILKLTATFLIALFWLWVVFVKAPVLLTSGTELSVFGLTLLALSVIIPGVLLWNFIKGKLSNTNPTTTQEQQQ